MSGYCEYTNEPYSSIKVKIKMFLNVETLASVYIYCGSEICIYIFHNILSVLH